MATDIEYYRSVWRSEPAVERCHFPVSVSRQVGFCPEPARRVTLSDQTRSSGGMRSVPSDGLGLRETPVEFFDGDLLDARGDGPLVAERINYCRHSIAVNNVARFLGRSCASSHGMPVNTIDIGNVHVERAASGPTFFERKLVEEGPLDQLAIA